MSEREALTLDIGDLAVWTLRDIGDEAAIALANRHYSKEVRGGRTIGGPGFRLVFVTPCERAVWISKKHSPNVKAARVLADGYHHGTYRCAMFRNESPLLSSALIREAMALTERRWGPASHGWQTYVDAAKVRSVNPGFCFKMAGWTADGWRGSKLSLVARAAI